MRTVAGNSGPMILPQTRSEYKRQRRFFGSCQANVFLFMNLRGDCHTSIVIHAETGAKPPAAALEDLLKSWLFGMVVGHGTRRAAKVHVARASDVRRGGL